MFCEQCGKEIKDGVKFCVECGWAIPAAPVQNVQPAVMPSATQTAVPLNQSAAPYSLNVPAGKKSNIVFLILAILFLVGGFILYIRGCMLCLHWYSIGSRWINNDSYFMTAYKSYTQYSMVATGAIPIGILFSIISLYRKPNKLYFWLSVSPCILLAIWNVIFFVLIAMAS
jgi:hypothetical protein